MVRSLRSWYLLVQARTSVWSKLYEAHDINDSDQIVGYGYLKSGEYGIFLMTPIPEPGMLSLIGAGIIYLRRRKYTASD